MVENGTNDHTLYRRLFSQMVAGCAVVRLTRDAEGTATDFVTLDVNPSYERLLGVSRAEVVGRPASRILPRDEFAGWLDVFGNVAATGVERRFERHSRANGLLVSGMASRLSADVVAASFEDVTAARRAEADIRQSEALYRLAVDAARLAAITVDAHTRKVTCSPELMEILGLPEGSPLDRGPDGLYVGIFAEDRPGLRALVERMPGMGAAPFELEFRIVRPTGELRWIRLTGRTWCDPGGRDRCPSRITGVVRDITDERTAAEAAAASEAGTRAFFEQSAAGVAVIDRSSQRIVRVNEAYCEIVGHPRASLVGADPLAITHPDDRPAIARYLADVHAGVERRPSVQRRVLTRDGRVVWTDVAVSPLVHEGAVGREDLEVIIDVTAQKKAEEDLERSRQEFQTVWSLAPTMMCAVDPRFKVVCVNPAFAGAFGFDRADLWRASIGEALGCPQALSQPGSCGSGTSCVGCVVHEALAAVFETGVTCRDRSYKTTVVEDGRPVERHFVLAAVSSAMRGERHALLFLIDVTDRERVADELRQSREQLRALAGRQHAAREEERAHIAREIHDVLAQDLTRLKIDLVRLKRWSERPGGGELAEITSRIDEMCRLADNTLDTVQHIATELRPVVLDSLGLSAAVEWYARDFSSRTGLACDLDVPEHCLRVPEDVATALYRILQESLTNVARHARATRVSVELRVEDTQVRLTVRDDGRGIPADVLASPRSIGLSGMRERAALLGGTLAIVSRVGGGTCVEASVALANR